MPRMTEEAAQDIAEWLGDQLPGWRDAYKQNMLALFLEANRARASEALLTELVKPFIAILNRVSPENDAVMIAGDTAFAIIKRLTDALKGSRMKETNGPCLFWHKWRHVREEYVKGATENTSAFRFSREVCVRCFALRVDYHGEKFTPSEWEIYSEAIMRKIGQP